MGRLTRERAEGWALVAVCAAVVVMGALLLVVAGCGVSNPAPATPPALSSPGTNTVPWTRVPVLPVGIRIPSIGAESHDVAPMGLNKDGTIQVPPLTDVQQLGWYDKGPTPGQIGPAVVLAHINGKGKPGLFVHLADLTDGALVEVDRADHTTAVFRVLKVETVAKTDFPTDAVYGDLDYAGLRLITCGGRLDEEHHRYLDQTIAFAKLDQVKPTT